MSLAEEAKSAIRHHYGVGNEPITTFTKYEKPTDDVPIIDGKAVHIPETPEPVIFQGQAARDMAQAYREMRRIMPKLIERIERYEKALQEITGLAYKEGISSAAQVGSEAESIANKALGDQ